MITGRSFFPLAIQRYITLIAFKHIDARYIVQNALVSYNVRRCYIIPVADLKQYVFRHVDAGSSKDFITG
jgi:hypothetical protein